MAEEINKIGFSDLLEKANLADDDIIVIEDGENTKRISFKNFRKSLISDWELPSTSRIYSSYKLNTAIDSFQSQLNKVIGRVEGQIEKINTDYMTEDKVKEKINEFSKQVAEIADIEVIKKALESKRNITDMITCDDIESGEDAKKIQIKNLSTEVIAAMLGNTPITPPAVPEGGWVQEDIADGSINARKLAKQYRFRGHYPEGDINKFTQDGLYLLGSSVSGLPKYKDDEPDIDRLMEVYNYGPNQYIMQKIYYCQDDENESRPVYYRKALLSRLHVTKFVANFEITDTFKITRDILANNISNAGVISSGNIFDITVDGNYLVKKDVKNLPNDKYDFTVSINNFDTRIEYIAKIINNDLCEVYECNSYLTSSGMRVRTEWKQTNTVKKSRLEGRKLHLFGDGVCFGLGSSDIPNLSFPALLTSKYGIKITNHALGDATIGNYNDGDLSERSVIKQIEAAQLSDADMAIIFAGGEDYKYGKPLGLNSVNDYTFKGALNTCIKNLMEKNPKIKLLIVTPLFRARLDADDFRNSDDTLINELYLVDYVDAMKQISEFNHIPCLDLYSTGMINKYNFTTYLKDRLYLNDAGHEMIADKIFSALNYFY